jgi:hypothetical protein
MRAPSQSSPLALDAHATVHAADHILREAFRNHRV